VFVPSLKQIKTLTVSGTAGSRSQSQRSCVEEYLRLSKPNFSQAKAAKCLSELKRTKKIRGLLFLRS